MAACAADALDAVCAEHAAAATDLARIELPDDVELPPIEADLQRLLQVGHEVVRRLEPDAQPHEAVRDARAQISRRSDRDHAFARVGGLRPREGLAVPLDAGDRLACELRSVQRVSQRGMRWMLEAWGVLPACPG